MGSAHRQHAHNTAGHLYHVHDIGVLQYCGRVRDERWQCDFVHNVCHCMLKDIYPWSIRRYTVQGTMTQRVSYLYKSFSRKESCDWWPFCGKRPATSGILCILPSFRLYILLHDGCGGVGDLKVSVIEICQNRPLLRKTLENVSEGSIGDPLYIYIHISIQRRKNRIVD